MLECTVVSLRSANAAADPLQPGPVPAAAAESVSNSSARLAPAREIASQGSEERPHRCHRPRARASHTERHAPGRLPVGIFEAFSLELFVLLLVLLLPSFPLRTAIANGIQWRAATKHCRPGSTVTWQRLPAKRCLTSFRPFLSSPSPPSPLCWRSKKK